MKKTIKMMIHSMENEYHRLAIKRGELKKIYAKKSLWENIKLTKEQEEFVRKKWHRYYQYFTGKYSDTYIPEIEYSTIIEPRMNNRNIALELEDKGRLPIIYGDVQELKLPKTIIMNASGIFYDGKGNVLSKEDAKLVVINYLIKFEYAIIKSTRGSCSGKDVDLINKSDFSGFKIERDFIVQELIENQEDIKKLNPHSLNTFRVMTYICDNEYHCAPLLLRMGGN